MLRVTNADNRPKPGELVAVSITASDWHAQPSQLGILDLSKMRTEAIEGIEQVRGVGWAVFGVDISFNDDTAKGFDVAWQAQLYGFARVNDRVAFSKSLRRRFHGDKRVIRPVVVKACDGTAKAFSYGLKPESVRRIAYWGEGKTRTGELPRKCWRTRKVSLRAREDVELRLFFDRIGLQRRLLLFRLKVVPVQYGFKQLEKRLE